MQINAYCAFWVCAVAGNFFRGREHNESLRTALPRLGPLGIRLTCPPGRGLLRFRKYIDYQGAKTYASQGLVHPG